MGPSPRRRGIQKYFSRPSKGCKTYGIRKAWRKAAPRRNDPCPNSKGVPLPTIDGFHGFDILPYDAVDSTNARDRRPLRCLSLYDGISTALVVLQERLKIDVDMYFSSEICQDAIKVQGERFDEHIIQVGSVSDITNKRIDEMGRIDLLIGGSPCEELSRVNPRRKGLLDTSGTGHLFFDYVRILKYLQKKSQENNVPLYWLFENTSNMDKVNCNIISSELQCSPVAHNAATYVPMERERFFWGNLPGMDQCPPKISVPPLQHFLKPGRIAVVKNLPTLTTNPSSQRSGKTMTLPVMENGEPSLLLITEQEHLFGFPEHYTGCGNLSISKRRQLLGKAWSVDVVAGLLKPLQQLFRSTCWLDLAKTLENRGP